jgi:hypothetical protein
LPKARISIWDARIHPLTRHSGPGAGLEVGKEPPAGNRSNATRTAMPDIWRIVRWMIGRSRDGRRLPNLRW